MFDRYGRTINYLRISVTDRCNLRCTYCMPAEGITMLRHRDILSFESIVAIARVAVELGINKIRLTGGEPLVRKGVTGLVRKLAVMPGLDILSMTTNGTLLAPMAADLRAAGLDSVNISLDTLDAAEYARLTRGGKLTDALAGIEAARTAGLPVKLNMVVFPETPAATRQALREFAESRGCQLQTIRHYRLTEDKPQVEAWLAQTRSLGSDTVAAGRSVNQAIEHFDRPQPCAVCNRIRLLANGYLKTCLHSEDLITVDPADPRPALEAAILGKPREGSVCTSMAIGQIGG